LRAHRQADTQIQANMYVCVRVRKQSLTPHHPDSRWCIPLTTGPASLCIAYFCAQFGFSL